MWKPEHRIAAGLGLRYPSHLTVKHAEAAVPGAGRRVHAHVSTHARVPVLTHRRAGGAIAVLDWAVAKDAVAGSGRLQAPLCEGGVVRTVQHRGERQRRCAAGGRLPSAWC